MFMNFKNLQMYGLAYKRKIKELINGKEGMKSQIERIQTWNRNIISIPGSGYFESDVGYWSKKFFPADFRRLRATRIRANQRGTNPVISGQMHFVHAGCNVAITPNCMRGY